MDIEAIKRIRQLQSISRSEVAKATKLSLSSISKLEKGGQVLADEYYEKILGALNAKISDGRISFNNNFLKVLLKDDFLWGRADYSNLFWLLDHYKDQAETISVYYIYANRRNILDATSHRILLTRPASAIVIRVNHLLIFIMRKSGYITDVADLSRHWVAYGADVREVTIDRDLKFTRIRREDVQDLIGV